MENPSVTVVFCHSNLDLYQFRGDIISVMWGFLVI